MVRWERELGGLGSGTCGILDLTAAPRLGRSASYKNQENINLEKVPAFKRHDADVGSSEVQVARLSARIMQISAHLAQNKKDFAARRGLEAILSQRKSLLQYMYKTDRCARSKGHSRHRRGARRGGAGQLTPRLVSATAWYLRLTKPTSTQLAWQHGLSTVQNLCNHGTPAVGVKHAVRRGAVNTVKYVTFGLFAKLPTRGGEYHVFRNAECFDMASGLGGLGACVTVLREQPAAAAGQARSGGRSTPGRYQRAAHWAGHGVPAIQPTATPFPRQLARPHPCAQ